MRSAERLCRALAAAVLLVLAGCGGGGNSSETHCVGVNCTSSTGQLGPVVALSSPQAPDTNVTAIVVDNGPSGGFVTGATNLPYVTVTVCAPGSSSACATIDHVFLDTGSIGLRVLRSAVASLGLPAVTTPAGTVAECYPFVIGAVWGPMALADLHIAGETASALPVQVIDDRATPQPAPTGDCTTAANGGLLNSVTKLQANGVLGIGMLRYDCGLVCEQGQYVNSALVYYACPAGATCQPAAVVAEQQVQNPVSAFAGSDNNGTIVALPAVPDGGASVARGWLVFGIGTQTNNQLPPGATVLHIETDPASPNYFYVATSTGGAAYPYSYLDSGSNGLFFNDATLSANCKGAGAGSTWYCPASSQSRSATISDPSNVSANVNWTIANADVLFLSGNVAFADLGGAASAGDLGAFVWGLPFFYGRSVYTSIWGQALALNGPWFAF